LADIRRRGFSVPLRSLTVGSIASAFVKVRELPTDERAERQLTQALQDAEGLLVGISDLAPDDEVTFTTVAAPIFDPIGRVLLSLSISGPDTPRPVADVLELGRRVARAAAVATREARGRPPVE
jgi:hypothetical protein